MNFDPNLYCTKCGAEVVWDTTEHNWGCDCFAVWPIYDDGGVSLEHKPDHWIDLDDRDRAILWARERLKEDFIILDTETTGLGEDDEIVSVAIVAKNGEVLLDTLLCHEKKSSPQALATHLHTYEETRTAPHFRDIHLKILGTIRGKTVLIYNADFDWRLLEQTAKRYKVVGPGEPVRLSCAMKAFARFYGEWNDYYGSYRWQSLTAAARHFGIPVERAHSAAGDALMTLRVVEAMAAALMEGEEETHA